MAIFSMPRMWLEASTLRNIRFISGVSLFSDYMRIVSKLAAVAGKKRERLL